MIKSPQEEDIHLKLPALFYDCAGLGCAPLYLRTIHGDHQMTLHNARYAAEKLISEIAQLCQHAHLYKGPFWHTPVVSSAKFHQAHTSVSSASGMQNLQTIITTQGPGSFTGIRIGLAAAHGFKCTAHQSVYAINRCDLYASIAMKKYKLNHCSFLLEMGKNNYFAGVYKHTHTPTYEHIPAAYLPRLTPPIIILKEQDTPPTNILSIAPKAYQIFDFIEKNIRNSYQNWKDNLSQPFYLNRTFGSVAKIF